MGKSLPRVCKNCNTRIKKNFNRHATLCTKRLGDDDFKGWWFYNKDGKRVDPDALPYRKDRLCNGEVGKSVIFPAFNQYSKASCWNRVKKARQIK